MKPIQADSKFVRNPHLRGALLTVIGAMLLTAVISHLFATWLNLREGPVIYAQAKPTSGLGNQNAKNGLILGSSLTAFGLSMERISDALNIPLISPRIGAASPSELEFAIGDTSESSITFIGVSIFDMNEGNISEWRPLIVPFGTTVRDLVKTRASWAEGKRVIWSYPMPMLRKLYPTAGRSLTVMVAIREKLRSLLKRPVESGEQNLNLATAESGTYRQKIADWDEGRVARNVARLRSSGLDAGHFQGNKFEALSRIVRRKNTILIVLPVSNPYRKAFATEFKTTEFEQSLQKIMSSQPNIRLVRLDTIPSLRSDNLFWDLVHLNEEGRVIATQALLLELKENTTP